MFSGGLCIEGLVLNIIIVIDDIEKYLDYVGFEFSNELVYWSIYNLIGYGEVIEIWI